MSHDRGEADEPSSVHPAGCRSGYEITLDREKSRHDHYLIAIGAIGRAKVIDFRRWTSVTDATGLGAVKL